MAITYEKLIEEVDGLTHMYGVDSESNDEEDENITEDEAVEGYIKDYRNNVLGIIWEKTAEQIYGKNGYENIDTIDEGTVVSQETITSISNELDAIKISEEMIIAFRYLLDEDGADIFDTIVEIYDTHGNLDICEYIADSGILDQVKAHSILYKLYYYCDQGKKFIEAIGLLIAEKGVRLDDFRKTGELDMHQEVSSFIRDIQRLILAKAGCTQISTTIH